MTEPAEPARPGAVHARGALLLALLYVATAVTYALVARVVKVPIIFPDEFTYGHVAQSIANGDGVSWRGDPVSLRSLLYVLAIMPSWVVSSGHAAYDIARSLNAVMAALVVIPVWLTARPLVGPRLALVPAVLSVAGSWMLTTAYLLSESLALPLAVASLAAMVASLRRPGSRWWIWALILAALATYARLQLVALAPVFFLALLVDTARVGPGRTRERLLAHRWPLVVTGGASLIGLIVGLSTPDALGIYASVTDFSPSLGAVLAASSQHALALVVICGFVPAVAVISLALRAENWRDDATGPLLAVLLCATLVLVLESGWFGAGFHLKWDIERYVEYVVPLSLVALMLVPGRVSLPVAAGVGAALAVLLLLVDKPLNRVEQRGVGGTVHRMGQVAHTFAEHPGGGLALACALVGIGGIALAVRPPRALAGGSGVLAVAGLVLVVLLAQSQTSWHTEQAVASQRRAAQPADLDWVDHHAKGTVGIFSPSVDNPNVYQTEFFNEKVRGRFHLQSGMPGAGTVCIVSVQGSGLLRGPAGCEPPGTLLVESSFTRTTFDGERRIDDGMPNSRLVEVGAHPRVLSFVSLPCVVPGTGFKAARLEVRPCTGRLDVQLWPAAQGTFIARFLGGSVQHYGQLASDTGTPTAYSFTPNQVTTIRIPVGPAPSVFTIQLDWPTTSGAPTLESVQLRRGSQVTDLL